VKDSGVGLFPALLILPPLSLLYALFFGSVPADFCETDIHLRLSRSPFRSVGSSFPAELSRGVEFVSCRLSSLVLFSPVLLLLSLHALFSGLFSRDLIRARFEFSSPSIFFLSRASAALSLFLAWTHLFIPLPVGVFLLPASSALLYVGLRQAAKHFPHVW
jgi:hypothetical protein